MPRALLRYYTKEAVLSTLNLAKGDSKVYSIAAASIIAKVTRDRIMMKYHASYPLYNFAQHKGYPTLEHRNALIRHGPCAIHRLTFGPVKASIKSHSAESIRPCQKAKSEATSKEENRAKLARKKAPEVRRNVEEPVARRRSTRLQGKSGK